MTTRTEKRAPTPLAFSKAVFVCDRDATHVSYDIDGDTVYQRYPADAPPGYVLEATRVAIPVDVQAAIEADFPVLRRIMHFGSLAYSGEEGPELRRLRRRLTRAYIAIVALLGVAAVLLVGLAQRR